MAVHKFFIVESLVNDYVEHAVRQRRIGARSQGQPHIGPRRDPGEPRVDRYELGPFVQADRKRLALVTVRVADHEVVAPDHDALGVVLVVDDGVGAAGDNAGGNARSVAEVPGRKHIWAAQQIGKAVDGRLVFPPRPIPQDDRFGPVPFFVGQDSLGDGVQGLVPGDALPLAARFRPDPLHRIGQPVGVVGELSRCQPFAAHRPVVDGAVRVPGDLGHLAGLSVYQNAAAAVAHAAVALDHAVIAVSFNFPLGVGVHELSHVEPAAKASEIAKPLSS